MTDKSKDKNNDNNKDKKQYASIITDIKQRKLDRLFTYQVPLDLRDKIQVGQKVEVPFANRLISGYVLALEDHSDYQGKLQSVKRILRKDLILSRQMIDLAYWLAEESFVSLATAFSTIFPNVGQARDNIEKMEIRLTDQARAALETLRPSKSRTFLETVEKEENRTLEELRGQIDISPYVLARAKKEGWLSFHKKEKKKTDILRTKLNKAQAKVATDLLAHYQKAPDKEETHLIQGVTGSGKTEVYFYLIEDCIRRKKQALVLFPEISLTQEMIARFSKAFGNRVRPWHSQMSSVEKKRIWQEMRSGEADILIGPRSAVFVDVKDLGLIIIDEEHDGSYQQRNTPCYDGRAVAKKRASDNKALLVMGSATPSLESLYEVKKGRMHRYLLSERYSKSPLPRTEIIDMRAELKAGHYHMFSRQLIEAMEDNIKEKKGILLFMNRRGYSGSVVCRDCGHTVYCVHCDIPMTYHRTSDELKCHYCGYKAKMPTSCPKCQSRRIRSFGVGTQKIEREAKILFPQAVVARIDGDISIRSGQRKDIIQRLKDKKIDILIGTQIISKGIDFPQVGLVSVISADTALNLPDFRAREKTCQQLIQVAGRAGRTGREGLCLIQTYQPQDPAIFLAQENTYNQFVEGELMERRRMHYPPYAQTIRILFRSEDENYLAKMAVLFSGHMPDNDFRVLGPLPASYGKIKNLYRWQIVILADQLSSMKALVKAALESFYDQENTSRLRVTVEINPASLL